MLHMHPTAASPIVTEPEHSRIREHYSEAIPWLVRHFESIPLIYATYPAGLGDDAIYHKTVNDAPATITTIDVRTSTGTHPYVELNALLITG